MTILEIIDLQQSYSAVAPVLRGVSLKIEQGEFVGIIGLSGSGKSIRASRTVIHGLSNGFSSSF